MAFTVPILTPTRNQSDDNNSDLIQNAHANITPSLYTYNIICIRFSKHFTQHAFLYKV